MNFSSPYISLPHRLSVRENLRTYGHLYNVPKLSARIAELAADLQLTELLDRPAGQLSAGQKTRVALAKSLINRPDLLLLDEPTASLDPDTGDWVRSWLERYRAETGCAILLASHNMAEVERLCDRVLMLKQGRVVDEGAPSELVARYGRDDLEQVFLDIARGTRVDDDPRGTRAEGTGVTTSLRRIWGLVYRHVALYRRSPPRVIELMYWPVLQMVVWGFVTAYLAGVQANTASVAAGVLLGGVLLWEAALRSQMGFSISFLEEIWSRNLGHIFVSPLRRASWWPG
jgi:hypothetical protein